MSGTFDDLDALRLTQSDAIQVERLIVNVPVRKPNKADFIQVHSSPDYRLQTTLAQDPDTHEQFLVLPNARGDWQISDGSGSRTVRLSGRRVGVRVRDLRVWLDKRTSPVSVEG